MSDVTGQDNAAADVPAVQQAVDAGGTVVLRGTVNFVNVSLPGPPGPFGRRVILVTGAVTIRGEGATILGGGSAAQGGLQAVFLVRAPGAAVTIEGIRFMNPHNAAIRVTESGDLRVARCQVDGMTPSLVGTGQNVANGAVAVHLNGGPFGAVSILENRLQIGGTADDSIGGIVVAGPAARLLIANNRIRDTTAQGLDLRDVAGPARVEQNFVETGQVGRSGLPGRFVNALRLIGSGEYVVAGNQFDCGFENAAVVRLGGTKRAVVRANEIVASVPAGKVPGLQSAGVQVQGSADANEIVGNRIKGRARAAISVIFSDFPLDRQDGTGNPSATTFEGNNVQHFAPTLATVEVGPGATKTKIAGGSGTISDRGTATEVHGNYQHVPA